jgi:Tfp pilus assembly protein PilN
VSTAAVGAALGSLGTTGDGLRINLLPKTVQEAQLLSRHVLATALAGVVVFLGLFVTAQLLARTTGALDRKIEQTRLAEELYTAPALIAEERFLDREILRCRQHLEPLRKALAARQETDWPGILEAVRHAAPAELCVTQLLCGDGRTLWVKGLTASCPAAEMFVRNLEGQGPFASVALAFVHRPPDTTGRLEYRIDCLLKGAPRVTERAEESPTKGGESL